MVQKPLIKQGYSLAEEIANSGSHGIGLVFVPRFDALSRHSPSTGKNVAEEI